jgi:hypothetical protein
MHIRDSDHFEELPSITLKPQKSDNMIVKREKCPPHDFIWYDHPSGYGVRSVQNVEKID